MRFEIRTNHSLFPKAACAAAAALPLLQNSTLLWEVLSAELMDECLATHHRIMREVSTGLRRVGLPWNGVCAGAGFVNTQPKQNQTQPNYRSAGRGNGCKR